MNWLHTEAGEGQAECPICLRLQEEAFENQKKIRCAGGPLGPCAAVKYYKF